MTRVATLAALGALALILLPLAAAHLQGARPVFQGIERNRIVDLRPDGVRLQADLSLTGDPLRHFVSHEVDPPAGDFRLEYRPDGSDAETAFATLWHVARLIEYRDANTNGRFDTGIDTPAKLWRFSAYEWSEGFVQRVQVGGVDGSSILWQGNITGGPQIRLEVAVAGREFDDEGVRVRPQDVAIYLDFLELPTRGIGHLYAFEWEVTVPATARLAFHTVEETPTALLALADLQTAIFLWGGEALVDGIETRYNATLEGEATTDGRTTARLVLHLPTADESLRFAFVSAIEYGSETRRQPLPWGLALVATAAVALAWRRRAT